MGLAALAPPERPLMRNGHGIVKCGKVGQPLEGCGRPEAVARKLLFHLIMNFISSRKLTVGLGLLLQLGWFGLSAPGAVPAQFVPRGPGGGGALFAPSFSPFSPGEMYLAWDMSEVFHSTNY